MVTITIEQKGNALIADIVHQAGGMLITKQLEIKDGLCFMRMKKRHLIQNT
jgi:hypothetical protein